MGQSNRLSMGPLGGTNVHGFSTSAYALEAAVPAMSTHAYPSRQGSVIFGSEKGFPKDRPHAEMDFWTWIEENPDSADVIGELNLQRMRESFLQNESSKQVVAKALHENAQMARGYSGVEAPTPPPPPAMVEPQVLSPPPPLPPGLAEEIIANRAIIRSPRSPIPKFEDMQGLATRSGELPSPPSCPSALGSSRGSVSSSESKTFKGLEGKRNIPKGDEQRLQ